MSAQNFSFLACLEVAEKFVCGEGWVGVVRYFTLLHPIFYNKIKDNGHLDVKKDEL